MVAAHVSEAPRAVTQSRHARSSLILATSLTDKKLNDSLSRKLEVVSDHQKAVKPALPHVPHFGKMRKKKHKSCGHVNRQPPGVSALTAQQK